MSATKMQKGFTLTELVITVAIIGILAAIALPSYNSSVVRASREAAQTEMLQMAALQEKIYLNSNCYSSTTNVAPCPTPAPGNVITDAYNGQATGGLGWSANSKDKKYTYTCPACTANSFTITATPVAGLGQAIAADGNLNISSSGQRTWVKGGVTQSW